jgi:hypothetical protein
LLEARVKSYNIGTRVSQTQYGSGTITAANQYHTVIDFDEHGIRTFSTPLVQLGHCDTAAPERPKRARRKPAPRLPKA